MARIHVVRAACLLGMWACLCDGLRADDPASVAYFESKVRPILVQRCYDCHSGAAKKIEANLRLDHLSLLLKGGDSGPAITTEKASAISDSLLLQAVRYEAFEMPPSGKLPQEEIAVLEKWVSAGAVWPEEPVPQVGNATEAFDLQARRSQHWAWQPRLDPNVPVTDQVSVDSPIDAFVVSAMKAHGLSPNPPAERAVLLRRLYLDLWGVPPTVQELKEALHDDDPAWYAKSIDRLLASPQFGVRFARHWLDLVRYAESRGHEFDEDVPGASNYRDYVVRAINDDIPYDQFVVEHIAGDLLPKPRSNAMGWNESVIATGFWHLGEWVHSPVDSRKDETDRFDNMIDVFSKSILGLTVACARCHDHKFDAIGTADYYALAGFLRSSHYRMVRFETDIEHQQVERARQEIRQSHQPHIQQSSKKLIAALAKAPAAGDALLKKIAELRGATNWKAATPLPSEDERLRVDFTRYTASDRWIADGPGFGNGPVEAGSFDLLLPPTPTLRWQAFSGAHFDAFWAPLKSTVDSTNAQNRYRQVDTSGRTLLTPMLDLKSGQLSYLIRGQCQTFVAVDSMRLLAGPLHGETRGEYRDDKAFPEYRWVTQSLQRYKGKRVHVEFAPIDGKPFEILQVIDGGPPEAVSIEATPASIEQTCLTSDTLLSQPAKQSDNDATKDRLVLAAILDAAISLQGESLPPETDALKSAVEELKTSIANWHSANQQLAAQTRWESKVAMAMIDGSGENYPILIRGNADNDGPIVARRCLEAFGGHEIQDAGSGRLQLARDIVDPNNPLTSRVLVNRLWHHLMGRGIVATTDDFGIQGQRPTHPELLDYLASRFVERGWSVKQMVRAILLSSTYQQSSYAVESYRQSDPDNIWLSRARVRRLEAEAVRDSLMRIADRLDMRLDSGSVPVHLTDFLEGRGRPGHSGPADGASRRSIFISVRRNFLIPMMSTFDAPNPFSSMGRRNVSSVPAQSLTLLNDPFVHQLAKQWSESVAGITAPEARLTQMYLAAFSREPSQEEIRFATQFLDDQVATGRASQDAWQDLAHVLMNMKELILRF